jgi:hypothetical protein
MIEDRHDDTLNIACREFQANLDDYLEGRGDPRGRAHAGQCSFCGALLADLESLRASAASLPLESPAPRVWSNIRATLAAEGFFRERESFWKRWFAQSRLASSATPAAAIALLVVLAIFITSPGDLRRRAEPLSASALVATRAAPEGLTAVETNLVRTVEQMENNYRAREASLDPAAQRTYTQGLTSLDNSIRECLVSLHEQPQNALARRYLMEAYTEKADVLASALEYNSR